MGKTRKNYSQGFKLMVVEDYLSRKSGGISKIAKKYNIPKDYMVTRWIRTYKEFGNERIKKSFFKYYKKARYSSVLIVIKNGLTTYTLKNNKNRGVF